MSKYSTLRAAITAAIYENTNESITGAVLQAGMLDIVNALDLGSLFLGVATAATVPSAEANGFYLALTGGTYANFLTSGGTEITVENREIAIIVPDGNAWRKIRILKLTSTVTENSDEVPDGGAVFNALAQKQPLLTAGDGITIDKDNVIHATVVEANPQEVTPDADLEALKVGNKVYSIPQGGTSDYDALEHKPSINSQPLSGNMTSLQLGLQDRLVSGTTIKTINGQPVLGSGNLNTANGYIHADDVTGMPEPSADYASKICLVPSTQNQGSLDQYACIENAVVEGIVVSGWSWVLIGTTAPIVSVQEIDMYGQIVPVYNEGKNVFGPGNYDPSQGSSSRNPGHMYSPSNPTGFGVLLFKVDFDNYDYLFNFIVNTGTVSSCIVNFYDENLPNWTGGSDQTDGQFAAMSDGTGSGRGAWLGGFGRNTTGATESVKYDKVTLDTFFDSIEWATNDGLSEHTMSWFKHTCKYVRISVYAQYDPTNEYYRPAYMYEKARIDQSVIKRSVTAGIINLFVATIQLPQLFNHDVTGDSSEIDTTDTLSPWGIIWPDTYNQVGRPTPVIAMLHGSNGYVNENCLGYTSGGWITIREKYLEAGFAVMDVNGYGITSGDSPDANSNHWGNPASVDTLDKAFEYLKQNYNICDKLLIAGTSMGGILALTYAKTHSNKVAAIGLFAPNNFAFTIRYLRNGTGSQTTYTGYKEQAWGYEYNGWQAALDDNYSHLIGYIPITECRVIDDNDIVKQFDWGDYDYEHRVDTLTKQLIDYFPSIPIRVWQGSADKTVYPSFTRQFVNALRRGNANITLRMCEGVNHTTISSSPFVQNEAVSWFKRFVD